MGVRIKIDVQNFRWFRLLPVCSSLFLGLAFLNVHLAWVVFFGALPYLYYLPRANQLTGKQTVFDCCLAAFVFALLAGGWTLQINPGEWLGLTGYSAFLLKVISWLSFAVCSALTFGIVVGLFVVRWRSRQAYLLALIPLAWACGELVRSYGLALLMYGPGGSLSPNWNYGSLGLAAAGTPIIYASRFVGLFGLTALVIIINLAIYMALRRNWQVPVGLAVLVFIVTFGGWQFYRPGTRQADVAAVNLQGAGASLTNHRLPKVSPKTQVLVLPENSHFFENKDYRQQLVSAAGTQTVIVTSTTAGHPQTNSLLYYSAGKGYISRQPKTFIAAFGEYMPYASAGLFKITGQQLALTAFQHQSQVERGSVPEHVVHADGLDIGALVCSGVLNLSEYQRLSRQGADVLTNSASLALLSTARLYHVQEYYQNRFHAVANAKPFVQSTRSGEAYVISSDGQVLKRTGYRDGLLQAEVRLQPKRTLYSLL